MEDLEACEEWPTYGGNDYVTWTISPQHKTAHACRRLEPARNGQHSSLVSRVSGDPSGLFAPELAVAKLNTMYAVRWHLLGDLTQIICQALETEIM